MNNTKNRYARCLAAGMLGGLLISTSVHAGTTAVTSFITANGAPNTDIATRTLTTTGITDISTGIKFDVSFLVTGIGGNLTAAGGTAGEWGIVGGNNTIDVLGEAVQYTLSSMSISDYNGYNPLNVTLGFDGFTALKIFFVGNDPDAGAITDGSSELFRWEGSQDPTEAATMFSYANFASGVSYVPDLANKANGTVSLAGMAILPTLLRAEARLHDGIVDVTGLPPTETNFNRYRSDDITGQFTITVVPEPSGVVLAGLGFASLLILRRRS